MAVGKLLATHDFHGAKSFAFRARESDPRLDAADCMLAVVDTILASAYLINNEQLDWYGILQLGHLTQSIELIADHYRRLALLLNPERNHFPFADQAFKLVSQAWSFLCDPNKKALYDTELRMIQFGHLGFQPSPTKSPRNKERRDPPPAFHEEQPPIFNNGGEPSRQTGLRGRPPAASSSGASQPADSHYWSGFWTACRYCYVLYEYPRGYEECALKCQGCERAYQGVEVAPSPVTDKDAFYNCWAYFPLGFSGNDKGPGDGPSWKPLSSMFILPQKNKRGHRSVNAVPRVYYDDEDIYVAVSDPSDDSDDADWGASAVKKRGRPPKTKSPANKSVTKKNSVETPRETEQIPAEQSSVGGAENLGVRPTGHPVEWGEPSRKGLGNPVRKQTGRGLKALGKLDLNVEFSNEVEEPSRAMNAGNRRGPGEEDNIEGTGFFEGLDKFLSSLPLLSVVNDDKVKAA